MNTIIVAFITGLTTGGLSCLMVQGGCWPARLAYQLEKDMLELPQGQNNTENQERKRNFHSGRILPCRLPYFWVQSW